MGDVLKDVERAKALHLSGSDKVRISSSMTDFVIHVFQERIRREHPKAGKNQILTLMREAFYNGRRDNV
jgi:hypothetical protein